MKNYTTPAFNSEAFEARFKGLKTTQDCNRLLTDLGYSRFGVTKGKSELVDRVEEKKKLLYDEKFNNMVLL